MSRKLTLALIPALFLALAPLAQGDQLFYAAPGQQEGQVTLHATDSATGEVTELIALMQAKAIGWSPNGRYFSFLQFDPPDDDTAPKRLFAYDCVNAQALNISARGHDVAGFWWADTSEAMVYLQPRPAGPEGAFDVYVHDMTHGSEARRVNGDLPAAGAAVVFSADGRYCAFAVADPGKPGQVAIADATAGEAWVASADLRVRGHQWSLAGTKLALHAGENDAERLTLHVADAESRSLTPISSESESVEGFSWRPGSTDMAYMISAVGVIGGTEEGEEPLRFKRVLLKMASAVTGDTRRVSNVSNATRFNWAPDGSYYAVSDMAVDPLSGVAQPSIKVGSFDAPMRMPQLVQSSSGSTIFAWSPDSAALAFMLGELLYKYSPAEQKSSVVVDSLTVRDMVWSPDSRHVAIMTPYEGGGIVVWNVDTEAGVGRIISHAFRTAGMVDWSPTGSSMLLYMPTSADVGLLNLLDPHGDPESIVQVAEDAITVTWYPKSLP
ncbi:MAG: hypothetical protein GF320_17225 [Armatimonadia bacterium]|nr:hypothetical protein [Armatimonadia bacterium]